MRSVGGSDAFIDLGAVDSVLLDSAAALTAARAAGLRNSARVFASNPALADTPGAWILDADQTNADIRAFGARLSALTQTLKAAPTVVPGFGATDGLLLARATSKAGIALQKIAALSRAPIEGVVAAVEPTLPVGSQAGSLWPRLLGGWPKFAGTMWFDPARKLASPSMEEVPSLTQRMRFEGVEPPIYRMLERLQSRFGALWRRGDLLVVSENALIKETVLLMTARGWRIRRAARMAPPVSADARYGAPPIALLAEHLADDIGAETLLIAQAALARAFAAEATERDAARAHWRRVFADCSGGRPAAVLTNHMISAQGEALRDLSLELNIPHFAFQHGVAVEFTAAFDGERHMREMAHARSFIAFSERRINLDRSNPDRVSDLHAIGVPREMLRRRRSTPRLDEPILYVSTQAACGHVMRASAGGISEVESAKWEIDVINEVLDRLPHRVLFKPYRAVRYLDRHPITEAAAGAENVTLFESNIDIRYLLPRAGAIVVAHTSSTLHWCVVSGRPVVYLHSEKQAPLRPEAEASMREALIFVDCDAPGFHTRLLETLSQPITALTQDWENRSAARLEFTKSFFGVTDGGAGRRAAALITSAIVDARARQTHHS